MKIAQASRKCSRCRDFHCQMWTHYPPSQTANAKEGLNHTHCYMVRLYGRAGRLKRPFDSPLYCVENSKIRRQHKTAQQQQQQQRTKRNKQCVWKRRKPRNFFFSQLLISILSDKIIAYFIRHKMELLRIIYIAHSILSLFIFWDTEKK